MACLDCKFFAEDERECRAHPPTVVDEEISTWPTVDKGDWCGEWVPEGNKLNSFGRIVS